MRRARRWGGWCLAVGLLLSGCGSPEAVTLQVVPGFVPADGVSTATATLRAPGRTGAVTFTVSRGTFQDSQTEVTNVPITDGTATATLVACDGTDSGCLGDGAILASLAGDEYVATVTFVVADQGDGG